jgi:hypothetical protein
MRTLALTVLMGLFLILAPARAGVIPVGLDWRKNVFVQEIWKDGVPYYVVANLGKEDVTVSVFEQKGDKVLAGPWKIAGKGAATHEIKGLVGKNLVTFKLADGTSLGMIFGPGDEKPDKKAIVSYYGLNGSGGRQTKLWIEQPAETVKAGEVFELTLKVPANVGTIRFPLQTVTGAIKALQPFEVVSATLPIIKDKMHEIDTHKPTKAEPIHTVTLRFRAPDVDTPTMFMINGSQRLPDGGGMGITRGVLVSPAKPK